ncbi:uncharacterized protein PG986_014907 [Apiospora aurea]|uniref:Uncharacterized protein n=1 Tax=Apiospora aurea TaxID=335848 RepID=A0ABR1PUC7_9PEZI
MTACNGYLTTTATGTHTVLHGCSCPYGSILATTQVTEWTGPGPQTYGVRLRQGVDGLRPIYVSASGQHTARASQVDQKGDVLLALVAITRKYLRNLLRQASPDGDHSNKHGPTDILDRTRAQKLREAWRPDGP